MGLYSSKIDLKMPRNHMTRSDPPGPDFNAKYVHCLNLIRMLKNSFRQKIVSSGGPKYFKASIHSFVLLRRAKNFNIKG